MAPPVGIDLSIEAKISRRRRIVHLAGRGWKQREIACEVRMTLRTVQRHLAHHQAGRPPMLSGWQRQGVTQSQ